VELEGTQKNPSPKKIQKFPTKPNQKCQIGPKNLKEGGNNEVVGRPLSKTSKKDPKNYLDILNLKSALA
jgi:hypothetical protein